MEWGNKAGSAEWTHIFGSELFSKLDLNASNLPRNFLSVRVRNHLPGITLSTITRRASLLNTLRTNGIPLKPACRQQGIKQF